MKRLWLIPLIVILALAASIPVLNTTSARNLAISTVLLSHDTGHGSAVHLGRGYLLSAAHVVGERPEMKVTDSNGNEHIATVLWTNTAYDLALLHVGERMKVASASLTCARLGIGAFVEGVGNPVNSRFVHMWGRVASTPEERAHWKNSFLVDMTVAPGMSGGPLFDANGNVAGVIVGMGVLPSLMSPGPLAITYAVPSSTVCYLLDRR